MIKRMVVTLFLVLSLCLSGVALAGNNNDSPGGTVFNGSIHHNDVTLGGSGGDGGSAEANSRNTNTNFNTLGQNQGQNQAQGQGQAQGIYIGGGSVDAAGNSIPGAFSTSVGVDQGALTLNGGDTENTNVSGSKSASSSNSNSNSSANNSIVFEDQRDFAPTLAPYYAGPGQVRYAPQDLDKVRGFIKLRTFAKVKRQIKLEGRVQDTEVEREVTLFVTDYAKEFPKVIEVTVEPSGDALAVGTMWSGDNEDSNTTAAVATEAARFCSKYGANQVYLIKQNVSSRAVTSGWGIGLSANSATMNSAGDISSVGSGGTGYSRSKGGHQYRIGLEFACMLAQ